MKSEIEKNFFELCEFSKADAIAVFIDYIDDIVDHCNFEELEKAKYKLSYKHPGHNVIEQIQMKRAATFEEKKSAFYIAPQGSSVRYTIFREMQDMARSFEEKSTLLALIYRLAEDKAIDEEKIAQVEDSAAFFGWIDVSVDGTIHQKFNGSQIWQDLYFQVKGMAETEEEKKSVLSWASSLGRFEDAEQFLDEFLDRSQTFLELYKHYQLQYEYLPEGRLVHQQQKVLLKMSKAPASVSDCFDIWTDHHGEIPMLTMLLKKLESLEGQFSEWSQILSHSCDALRENKNQALTDLNARFYSLASDKIRKCDADLDTWLKAWEKHTYRNNDALCQEEIEKRCHTLEDWSKVLRANEESCLSSSRQQTRDWIYKHIRHMLGIGSHNKG